MRIRVKICGVTTSRDAATAIEAGADAVGFVLWNGSPRRIQVAEVMRIGLALPPYVARVGVFVDELRPVLVAAMRNGWLTTAQLHGEEDPDFAGGLNVDWYRVFRVSSGDEPGLVAGQVERFGRRAFMLDTRGSRPGGSGRAFDWGLAAEISRRVRDADPDHGGRMILAGGLTPDNVATAIRSLRDAGLWAVDVSTGVEMSPGIKDPLRVRRFIEAVRGAE